MSLVALLNHLLHLSCYWGGKSCFTCPTGPLVVSHLMLTSYFTYLDHLFGWQQFMDWADSKLQWTTTCLILCSKLVSLVLTTYLSGKTLWTGLTVDLSLHLPPACRLKATPCFTWIAALTTYLGGKSLGTDRRSFFTLAACLPLLAFWWVEVTHLQAKLHFTCHFWPLVTT